jgi:alpha-glucosidase/alpha-D-xyloside xylohydrolase
MSYVKNLIVFICLTIGAFYFFNVKAQSGIDSDSSGILEIREVGEHSVRITLKPSGYGNALPYTPALSETYHPSTLLLSINGVISSPVKKQGKNLHIEVIPNPLRIKITNKSGQLIQDLVFNSNGGFSFAKSELPVLGMGEGGPRPEQGDNWRTLPVQFDRNGSSHSMIPRWQSDAYGSRNPVALMIGTEGWALFVATPWGQIDLQKERGVFFPENQTGKTTQDAKNQQQNRGKGLPPAEVYVKGLIDMFVFDAHNPSVFMKELSQISGPSVMPPLWSLGYMQSHRTLTDENQIIGIVDTFRKKKIPIDAVIYLGTGFSPRGWNTLQPSFEFNSDVFKRKPEEVITDLHKRNVKIILHIVPLDRDKLPTLHGTIPAAGGEVLDVSHIQNYWKQHLEDLMKKGVDAFWPDEGDWFNLFERIKRHQMYYQGPLSTKPDVRPWSLHRNGHLGIAQWGGWVWSGDTQSSWKTLEAQIAVGLNYSLSISPYWGSDIGGFYPNPEKTGELYARWYQFGAFCASFRSHGRTWFTSLPWGYGLSDMGPREDNNKNTPANDTEQRNPLPSELNNPAIEIITRKYTELRYQLLPYTYTLAWEAHTLGLPLMRAMWLHYPNDKKAVALGNQYMWGRDLLIAPVYEKGATSRTIYLPDGLWYDWWNNEMIKGGEEVTRMVDLSTIPIYVRAGAIIPIDPVRQYTGEPVAQPTTIQIYTGSDGKFSLYEDDGISLKYLEKQGFRIIHFSWNEKARTLTLKTDPIAGSDSASQSTKREFILKLLPEGKTMKVEFNGKKQTIKI